MPGESEESRPQEYNSTVDERRLLSPIFAEDLFSPLPRLACLEHVVSSSIHFITL